MNTQIEAYESERPLKQHEDEMMEHILSRFGNSCFTLLDIGCADGTFIEAAAKRMEKANFVGIDISQKLIEVAKSKQVKSAKFITEDGIKYETEAKFDVIVCSGILSIFECYKDPLTKWLDLLKVGGCLFVFGRFNTEDIDVKIEFKNNYNNSNWEGGLTAYSIRTIGGFINELGFKYKFRKFKLSSKIQKSKNPIRTYTLELKDNSNLVVNGANIIAEQYFLIISKKNEI